MSYKIKHILFYVEDSQPLHKVFRSKKAMGAFIKEFLAANKHREFDGWWIDATITGVTGELVKYW